MSLSQVLSFTQALGILGIGASQKVYWAGRSCLLTAPAQISLYNQVFQSYWLGRLDPLEQSSQEQALQSELTFDDEAASLEEQEDSADENLFVSYSPAETLSHKDFADYTPAEREEAKKAIARMKISGPKRISRRLQPSKSRSSRLDLKRISKLATQTAGEPIRQVYLKSSQASRRLILLLDISGSMQDYARALTRFAHTAKVSLGNVEIFALSTSLTRLTRELSVKDPDLALKNASLAASDWSSGTRLGEGIEAFNSQWGARGLARGAVVIILSDGWDKGDPQKLSEQMARLKRIAHKVIWVNPLKATKDYEPLAQGMAAALPWIDDFVEGHSLFSLKNLVQIISDSQT